jgi:hypothetical protein
MRRKALNPDSLSVNWPYGIHLRDYEISGVLKLPAYTLPI